ncbi:MAG: hypothetical protein ACYCZF_08145 [Anaerolineae bacterium]
MKLPGGRVIVNHHELDNLIDQLRIAVPQEIKQAKAILAERETVLSQVQRESQINSHQAKDSDVYSVDDQELVRKAKEKAQTVLREAQEESLHITNGADEYAEESLRHLAQSVEQLNSVIQNGLHALARRRSQRTQKGAVESGAGTVAPPSIEPTATS